MSFNIVMNWYIPLFIQMNFIQNSLWRISLYGTWELKGLSCSEKAVAAY